MAITLVVNNVPYQYPQQGDSFLWGTSATNWATGVTNSALFKSGGNFFLSANVDFGTVGGLKSVFFSGRGIVANTGLLRLANTDSIVFAGDYALSVNTTSGHLKVNTALEMPDAFIQGQNVLAQIGNAFMQANVALTDAALAFSQANVANTTAGLAYGRANLAYAAANAAVQSVVAANASNLAITTVSGVVTIDTKITGGGGGGTANIAAGPGITVSGNLVSLNVANDITWTGNNKWTGPHGTTVANSFGLLVGSGSQGANQFLQTITVGNTSAANFSTWRWLTQNTGFISLTSFNDARNASFDALFIQKGSLGNVQAVIIGDTSNTTLITARGLFNVTANLYIQGNDVGLAIANSYNQANLALTTAQNSNLTIQAANASNLSVVYTGNTVAIDTLITGGGGGNGSGTVTSVGTGLGLSGGPISTTGTIIANIASVTVQGITKLIDSISSTDTANAATANAVRFAFDSANSNALAAYAQANTAYANGNTTAAQVTLAFNRANTAYANGNTTAAQVTLAFNKANLALTTAQNSNLVIQAANASNLVVAYTGNTVSIDTALSSGGTPGGSTTQIQYNNAGAFGGSGNLTWNNTTSNIAVEGNVKSVSPDSVNQGLYFSNTTADHMVVAWNVTTSSLDFTFIS